MKKVRAAALLSLLSFASISSLHGLDMQKVTVSLSSASVSDPVPFDEPFILKGDVSPQVRKLTMLIGKASGLCSKPKVARTTPPDACGTTFAVAEPIADAQEWIRRTAADNAFQFIVPALDPNSCYEIRFKQELAPASEAERKELQAQLAGIAREKIGNIAKNQSSVDDDNFRALEKDLDAAIKTFVDLHFNACPPPPESLQPNTAGFNAVRVVFDETKKAVNFETDIAKRIASVEQEMCVPACPTDNLNPLTHAEWQAFRDTLKKVIEKPALLSTTGKGAWDSVLGGAKVSDLARIAVEVSSSQAALDGLLRGSFKIGGPVLVATTAVDISSIEQLGGFFALVRSDLFTLASPVPKKGKSASAPSPVFSPHFRTRTAQLQEDLEQLALSLHGKTQALAAVNASTYPDLLASRLLSQSFNITTSPTLITANKNPYISADVGLGYASRVSKGFPYAGANFYFVPVNKNAPLNRFSGMERFKKTTSILVGLTTSAFEEGRLKNFFSAGSPMVGVGYRFNQFVKVNGGIMAFKVQDPNPAVDRKETEISPFASISIDLDLKTFLGNVGNLF